MTGVHVEGLRETTRALEAAGVDVNDLKDVLGSIAAAAADEMRQHIPLGRRAPQRGRVHARDTIRPNRAKGKAVVTLGGPKAPHAHVLRHTHPSRFVERTDTAMESRAVTMLEEGWAEIAKRNGLT